MGKINTADLSQLLADSTKISKNRSDNFVKLYFDLIIEGLNKDGVVKIKGLGTFKLTDVESRESMNVNTGERFVIERHKKITFSPDNEVKDLINKPFAMFDLVEIEPVADASLEMRQDEKSRQPKNKLETESVITSKTPEVEIDTETEPIPPESEEEYLQTEEDEQDESQESIEPEEEAADEDNEQPETGEEADEAADNATDETAAGNVTGEGNDVVPKAETPSVADVERVSKEIEEKKTTLESGLDKPKGHKTVTTIIAIMLSLFLLVGGFWYYKNYCSTPDTIKEQIVQPVQVTKPMKAVQEIEKAENDTTTNSMVESRKQVVQAERVQNENVAVATSTDATPKTCIVKLNDRDNAKPLADFSVGDTLNFVMKELLCEHSVAADETMTRISNRYYGTKKMWPYIVKYNNLNNPNGLCKGMTLKIPLLKER